MRNADIYAKITERVLAQLEAGTVPWQKPWSGGARRRPRNLVSKQPYHGINVFVTACQGFTEPWWLTINQLKKLNGCDLGFCRKPHKHAHVRKGETGTPIIFWKAREFEAYNADLDAEETRTMFLARYSHVWNVAQVEGIEHKVPADESIVERAFAPLDECERVVRDLKVPVVIEHRLDQRAYYHANTDRIQIPRPETFESAEHYYSTLFHELTHWTGHPARLNRPGIAERTAFGDESYSKEELIAELGATFLCGAVGIENRTVNTSAAYLQHWAERLRGDHRLILQAASEAQKAADFVLGVTEDA